MRTLDERKTREKALQDERFKVDEGSRGNVERFYGITEASHGYFRRRLNELARNRSVLEFGCGNGAHALELCDIAAHVTGIDISDVAVEIGTANARAANLPNVDFYAMDDRETRVCERFVRSDLRRRHSASPRSATRVRRTCPHAQTRRTCHVPRTAGLQPVHQSLPAPDAEDPHARRTSAARTRPRPCDRIFR